MRTQINGNLLFQYFIDSRGKELAGDVATTRRRVRKIENPDLEILWNKISRQNRGEIEADFIEAKSRQNRGNIEAKSRQILTASTFQAVSRFSKIEADSRKIEANSMSRGLPRYCKNRGKLVSDCWFSRSRFLAKISQEGTPSFEWSKSTCWKHKKKSYRIGSSRFLSQEPVTLPVHCTTFFLFWIRTENLST